VSEPEDRVVAPHARPLRLVVATDFSAGGARAVERAGRLLTPGSEVLLVHVLAVALRKERDLLTTAQEELEACAARIRQTARDVVVKPLVAFGDPCEEILRVAEAEPRADLVVLGRHGTRRFRNLMIGTTAERVVRQGTVPVVIVHGAPKRPYQRLLAALELPPQTSRRSLDLGMRLVVSSAAGERRVVHVRDDMVDRALRRGGVPEREQYAERRTRRVEAAASMQAWLKTRYGGALRWRVSIRAGDPRVGILAVAERHKPDLICIGTHARTGLSRFFLGSVAEAVLHGVTCDVLIARPDEALEAKTKRPVRKGSSR
jgi:nucleotide-binding universal stress UspA family protein